jgi:hypothetical protein
MSLFLMVFCLLFTIVCLIMVAINMVKAHVWREKGKSFDIGFHSGTDTGKLIGYWEGVTLGREAAERVPCKVCGHYPNQKLKTRTGRRPILTEVIDE